MLIEEIDPDALALPFADPVGADRLIGAIEPDALPGDENCTSLLASGVVESGLNPSITSPKKVL